jgi:hypothetical protein
MDYDKSTTRFHPVLNPTLPFGVITGITINIAPSVGVISFKTAKMTLRIFDRSRLNEIADFLNPKLYQTTTIWLTYGWRAPRQVPGENENPYLKFINENMMTREAYGIKSTSISIDNTGSATIILDLFTKGTSEMIHVAPTANSIIFEAMEDELNAKRAELKDILNKLGIKTYNVGGADARGSILINAANGGTTPDIDYKTFQQEYLALSTALQKVQGEDAKRALGLINDLYSRPSQNDPRTKAQLDIDNAAKNASISRFDPLKSSAGSDLFTVFDKKFERDSDNMPGKKDHPLFTAIKNKTGNNPGQVNAEDIATNQQFGEFGRISFGRLFFNYFQQVAASTSSVIDEYQVIFYRLNSQAGTVGSINIAEFPIDMALLEKAYAKRVKDQKGERMSILNFLEIVRESQFSDIRHLAFGFRDLFTYKDGKLLQDTNKASAFNQRLAENGGGNGSFVQPVIDFFVETGYLKKSGDTTVQDKDSDLLKNFERLSVTSSANVNDVNTKRIMRIHIYDRASTPHRTAATIMKQADGKFVEVDMTAFKSATEKQEKTSQQRLAAARASGVKAMKQVRTEAQAKTAKKAAADEETTANNEKMTAKLAAATKSAKDPDGATKQTLETLGIKSEAYDFGTPPSFSKVKNKISEFTPTILIGANGTAVQNVSYSTGQDALLSTIMMLRNNTNATSTTNPDGSSGAGLPLRVIPGQLSLTTLGCPLVDYMQQYFVDLGTGTTIDNLYNVTGLTHTIAPGKYHTEIKLTFHDAYGQYENPASFVSNLSTIASNVETGLAAANKTNK